VGRWDGGLLWVRWWTFGFLCHRVSYTEIISALKTLCSHIQLHMTSHNQTAAYHLNMRKTYLLPLEENVDFCIWKVCHWPLCCADKTFTLQTFWLLLKSVSHNQQIIATAFISQQLNLCLSLMLNITERVREGGRLRLTSSLHVLLSTIHHCAHSMSKVQVQC
jgi:hypothetical protein